MSAFRRLRKHYENKSELQSSIHEVIKYHNENTPFIKYLQRNDKHKDLCLYEYLKSYKKRLKWWNINIKLKLFKFTEYCFNYTVIRKIQCMLYIILFIYMRQFPNVSSSLRVNFKGKFLLILLINASKFPVIITWILDVILDVFHIKLSKLQFLSFKLWKINKFSN